LPLVIALAAVLNSVSSFAVLIRIYNMKIFFQPSVSNMKYWWHIHNINIPMLKYGPLRIIPIGNIGV
jgi:hypothetical protein